MEAQGGGRSYLDVDTLGYLLQSSKSPNADPVGGNRFAVLLPLLRRTTRQITRSVSLLPQNALVSSSCDECGGLAGCGSERGVTTNTECHLVGTRPWAW